MSSPAAVPAATLIVLRDRLAAPPEVLMVERSDRMAFAPGALVFPGGRIEPGDHALAATPGDAPRIAAIRETLEEAGLLVAADAPAGAAPVVRAALASGASFADALAAGGAVLRPERLVPFARWRPSHHVARVFDASFFLARAPEGSGEPVVDGTENARAFWIGAADALAQVRSGAAKMIFPTRRTTERLATFASVTDAVADAHRHPVRLIEPWIEDRAGERYLCIPDDLGFPVTAERMADAVRG